MDYGQVGPARLTVPQPVVYALAGIRARRVSVQAGGFVDNQQVIVFMDKARQHVVEELHGSKSYIVTYLHGYKEAGHSLPKRCKRVTM